MNGEMNLNSPWFFFVCDGQGEGERNKQNLVERVHRERFGHERSDDSVRNDEK